MALRIDDPQVEAEILAESERAGISPGEVVRRALEAQRARTKDRADEMRSYLESHVWPKIPADQIGRRLTKTEEERLLGYGPDEF